MADDKKVRARPTTSTRDRALRSHPSSQSTWNVQLAPPATFPSWNPVSQLTHPLPPVHLPQAFLEVFDKLRAELVQAEKDDDQVKIAVDWIDRMIEYNCPHGKLNRGLAVVDGMRAPPARTPSPTTSCSRPR